MKLRLQARYSLIVVTILAAIVVLMAVAHLVGFRSMIQASTGASSRAVTNALYQQVREQGAGRARLLADMLADHVFRLQVDRIDALLSAAAKQEGTVYVEVRDDRDRVISVTLDTGNVVSVSHQSSLHLVAPIRIGRRVLGHVKVGMSLADTKADIATMGRFMDLVAESTQKYFVILYLLIAVIIVALGLGIGLVMVRNITQPIHALSRYTRRIGTGIYDDPPPFERADELGDLAQDLKTMAENLKRVAKVSRLATLGEMTVGVNTIRLAADNAILSKERGESDSDFTDAKLRLISDQAANMGEIIQRMCVIGGGTGAQTTIDSRESVLDAYSLLGNQYEDEGIHVSLDIPDTIMPVLGRRNELAQVMINLLSNAKDAISETASWQGDGPSLKDGRIEVRMESQPDEVIINVTDNGIGIPPERIERVFDPFFTTKEATKGTGLGLSISFGIVDAMGGRLTAESNGAGSVFTVSLPRADEARK